MASVYSPSYPDRSQAFLPRIHISGQFVHMEGRQMKDHFCALSGPAFKGQAVLLPVLQFHTFIYITQAVMTAGITLVLVGSGRLQKLFQLCGRDADPVICNDEYNLFPGEEAVYGYLPALALFFQDAVEKGVFHNGLKGDFRYGVLQDDRINIGEETDFPGKAQILYFHVIGHMADFIADGYDIFTLVQGQLVKAGE